MERKAIFLLALLGLYGRVLLAQNPFSINLSATTILSQEDRMIPDSLPFAKVDKVFRKTLVRRQSSNLEISPGAPDTSQQFTYLAGKPIFHKKENKAHQKSLSTLSKTQKHLANFVDRLYQVQDLPFEVFMETKLYFPLGAHHLNQQNRNKLRHLIQLISENQPGPKTDEEAIRHCFVRISGFADSIPFYPWQSIQDRKKGNQLLSTQRAKEVMHFLKIPLKEINPTIQSEYIGLGEYADTLAPRQETVLNQRVCLVQVFMGKEIGRYFYDLPEYLHPDSGYAQKEESEIAKNFWKALDKGQQVQIEKQNKETGKRIYTFPAPKKR